MENRKKWKKRFFNLIRINRKKNGKSKKRGFQSNSNKPKEKWKIEKKRKKWLFNLIRINRKKNGKSKKKKKTVIQSNSNKSKKKHKIYKPQISQFELI